MQIAALGKAVQELPQRDRIVFDPFEFSPGASFACPAQCRQDAQTKHQGIAQASCVLWIH